MPLTEINENPENYNSHCKGQTEVNFYYKLISALVNVPFLSVAFGKMAVQISKKRKVSELFTRLPIEIRVYT